MKRVSCFLVAAMCLGVAAINTVLQATGSADRMETHGLELCALALLLADDRRA